MNDLSTPKLAAVPEHQAPANKIRFVTAASLFDGHDASINIMRRILQSNGVEVVHLGHNRSVDEVVTAALAEAAKQRQQALVQGRDAVVVEARSLRAIHRHLVRRGAPSVSYTHLTLPTSDLV